MGSKKHPSKEIQEAIAYALGKGWRLIATGNTSHAFCRLYCMEAERTGCKISVWSTPRNTVNHARQIKKAVDACPHSQGIQ